VTPMPAKEYDVVVSVALRQVWPPGSNSGHGHRLLALHTYSGERGGYPSRHAANHALASVLAALNHCDFIVQDKD